MTVTAAVACVAASTVLFPLFTYSLWFAAATGGVITVAATGALTRLRTLPVLTCLAASVAGLLLYLNLVFEGRHSLLAVIPTPASISALWALAGTGLSEASKYAPQVPNLPGLLLLAAGGVGITAVLTDLIAVRLRSAALAGLPLLVLFTVPVMMNAPRSQLATGLVFCLGGAGYLAMLSADGRERIRVWGRLVSLWRTGPPRRDGGSDGGSGAGRVRGAGSAGPGPDTRALAAAGRRVGLASIVLALCTPLLVPGLHPSKLFSSGPGIGGTGGGTGPLSLPSALAQTVAQLHESRPSVVFRYTTTASVSLETNDAQYFRQYVFDTLGDTGWQVTDYSAGAVQISSIPAPQGLKDASSAQQVTTTVTATRNFPSSGSEPTFLPLLYPAVQVYAPGKWLVDPDLMVYSTSNSIAGQSYSMASLAVDPGQAQLEAVPKLTKTASLAPDLQLPSSYQTTALKKLAEKYAGGKITEFGEVNALAGWLSEPPFSYSLSAAPFDSAAGLLAFLTKTRSGFCVQSAYAMTVLTRLLGIPARFVVGYTAGTRTKDGKYQVKNTDAHAWTEVYFPSLGWIRFEPTPGGQGTANPPNYMTSSAGSHGQSGITNPVPGATTGPGSTSTSPYATGIGKLRGLAGPGGVTGLPGKPTGTPWAAIVLAVIAAIVLACGVIAIVAPPAQRALSFHPAGAVRRRRPVTVTSAALAAAAAALVALALYRLLARASGPDLRAGWATVGLAFGAAGLVVLIAPAACRVTLRRWRWMRATDDVSLAHAAWREFHDDLADFGVGSRPSEPPRTLASRVTAGLPDPASTAIRRLALAEERACYAARPSGSQTLRRDVAAARRGLAASARRGARWRARIFPASLMTALAEGAARIPDRAAALRHHRRTEHKPAS
jgi:transglutaminase-like putative cysteine protease